jgi:hypothetical protein
MTTVPPAYAARLLKKLVPTHDHDALLGDITEEAPHRSHLWYWTQLAAVLVVGSWRDVRRHPLLALRAIALGIATLVVAFAPASAMLRVVRVLSEGGYYLGPYWLTLPPNAFRWLPAVINPLGFAASGWAIVRAHRAFGMTLLVPWMLLVCVPPAIMLLLIFGDAQSLPLTAPIVGGIVSTLSLPMFVLIGGALALHPTRY